MKKLFLFSIFTLTFMGLSSVLNATVFRVNSAPGSTAAYTTAQAAHDAASANDTLYLESSGISYGTLSCNKPLTIIGTGYFLSQNPQTQAIPAASVLDYLYFDQGSQGSKITGCTVTYIYLYVGNINITRNYINGYNTAISQATGSPISNVIISQNYITVYYIQWTAISLGTASNIMITNNYIFGSVSSGTDFFAILANNVFDSYISVYNSTLTNNIMNSGSFTNYNCTYTNNLANGDQFGNQNGNQQNVTMTDVFLGYTGNSTDGQWKLKPLSPAIGAGENGIDCGMYGGTFPYILSGMPNIPAIYYMNAPAIPSNSINVSIKAKSHN